MSTAAVAPQGEHDHEPQSKGLRGLFRVISWIERVGNKLPHPFWLFCILGVIVMALSAILANAGVSLHHPKDGKVVAVKNLLSTAGIQEMLGNAVENYAVFPPLATIMTLMLGIALAERSGLIIALLRRLVQVVPGRLLTFALAFAAMISHAAGDAAYVALIPLGGMLFKTAGRSPLLGCIVAFVSISAGYDASPVLTTTDVLLSGITTAAAATIDPNYVVTPLGNYWFSLASSVIVSVVIALVVDLFLVKRPDLETQEDDVDFTEDESVSAVSSLERKGLVRAGIAALVFVALVVVALVPHNSPFRGEDHGIVNSPVISGMAVVLALFFGLIGGVYGFAVKEFTAPKDLVTAMIEGIRSMAPILVLFFAISQFLAWFKWTNLGTILAIAGADWLGGLKGSGWLILLGIAVVITVMNLVVTSGSALWSLAAPVFVPMLMLLGIAPEATQAIYRVADSVTNCITPMSPYFAMCLGFIQRYRPKAGMGTLASFTMPIAAVVWVVWVIVALSWYALGIPFGPA